MNHDENCTTCAAIRAARGLHRELLKTEHSLKLRGFTRGQFTGGEAKVLKAVLPTNCRQWAAARYVPGFRGKRAKLEGGWYFRSPKTDFSLDLLLSLARVTATREKKSLSDALKRIIAMTDNELRALVALEVMAK